MDSRTITWLPGMALVCGALALTLWVRSYPSDDAKLRLPGADAPPGTNGAALLDPAAAGRVVAGNGAPGMARGAWAQFRGPTRDGISTEQRPLARAWDSKGPRELWGVDCGEGYAGVVIANGCAFLMDYDAKSKLSALRCLSVNDGRECWRYEYPLALKRNHGMTRTVPAVAGGRAVAIDSKCNVLCVDASTGAFRWGIDMVRDCGSTIPPWYTGQCPLIDSNAVILAPGGRDALLMAVDLGTGKVLWRSPNPHGWKMTHSSVMPMEFEGRRSYVYCASGGVAGVAAADGAPLWEMSEWKISIATIPSPLVLSDGRIFLSGGYNAGSMVLQLRGTGNKITPQILFKLAPEVFGATQHTPIFHEGRIYGVRPNGQFVCLEVDGKVAWTTPPGTDFGLGPYLLADGLFFVMNDSGTLRLLDGGPGACRQLAEAKVLTGRESWGPMALADGRLFVRDLTRLVCLDVSATQMADGR